MSASMAWLSDAYRWNMVLKGVPTPVSHSASVGAGARHFAKAYRIDSRMRSIESMRVPSKSNSTAVGRGRRARIESVGIAKKLLAVRRALRLICGREINLRLD